ncbi:MAG: alpha/beta fold hydrolase [Acidimicrobiales bacterium]
MLLPGFQSSSVAWIMYGYPEELGSYRLIMIDPLGHGKTEMSHNPSDYMIEKVVRHVTAVLDAEGIDRAPLVGFSRGGMIAAHMVDLAPERLSGAIIGAAPLGRARDDIASLDDGLESLLAGDWAGYWDTYPVPLPAELMRRFEEVNDPKANGAALQALGRWPDENPSEGLGASDVPRLVYFGSGEVFADSLRSELVDKGVAFVERDWAGHAETMSDATGVSAIIAAFVATL